MKDKILELRAQGKNYNEIKEILGCSKGTISYHCGEGQKEKSAARRKSRRKNILLKKVETFRGRKSRKDTTESIRKFQKRDATAGSKVSWVNKNIETSFTWEDVISKFSEDTVCYLSGEPINLYERNYQLDHIIPHSRGGSNSLENLGITHKTINTMKSHLIPEELIFWCEKILKYNGYEVIKK